MAKQRIATIDDRLGEMLRSEPFQPFDLKKSDGDTIHVFHPDYAIRSPGGRTAVVFDRDDHMRIVNMQHVTKIEPRKQPAKKKAKR
jgi:hypothetical protein